MAYVLAVSQDQPSLRLSCRAGAVEDGGQPCSCRGDVEESTCRCDAPLPTLRPLPPLTPDHSACLPPHSTLKASGGLRPLFHSSSPRTSYRNPVLTSSCPDSTQQWRPGAFTVSYPRRIMRGIRAVLALPCLTERLPKPPEPRSHTHIIALPHPRLRRGVSTFKHQNPLAWITATVLKLEAQKKRKKEHMYFTFKSMYTYVMSMIIVSIHPSLGCIVNRYPANVPEKKLKKGAKRIVMGQQA